MCRTVLLLALSAIMASLPAGVGAQQALEVVSSIPSSEGSGMASLVRTFEDLHPGTRVAAAAEGPGAASLWTRMLAGDPPDVFQTPGGRDLIDAWVVAGRVEDLSALIASQGWDSKMPKALLALLSDHAGTWSVPLDVRRTNLLWYLPGKLAEWGVKRPRTLDDLLAACTTLQQKGVTHPLAVPADRWNLWEAVALGMLGATGWTHLWSGKHRFDDPLAVKVWDVFGALLDMTDPADASLPWQKALDRLVNWEAAFSIMGLSVAHGSEKAWSRTSVTPLPS